MTPQKSPKRASRSASSCYTEPLPRYVQAIFSGGRWKFRGWWMNAAGQRRWSKLFTSADAAHEFAKLRRHEAPGANDGRITLGEAVRDVMSVLEAQERSVETRRWYAGHLKVVLQAWDGTMPLVSFTTEEVEAWIRHRRDVAGVSPNTVLADLRALSRLFHVAAEQGNVPKGFNPAADAAKPRQVRSRPLVFAFDRAKDLIARVAKGTNPSAASDADLMLLVLHTGVRKTELARLQVEDITGPPDQEHGLWIREKVGGRERWLPTPPELREVLARLRSDCRQHIVPGRSLDQRLDHIRRVFTRASKRLGERITTHSLRHTFKGGLRRRGHADATIDELMGHQAQDTAALYDHAAPAELVEAMASLWAG